MYQFHVQPHGVVGIRSNGNGKGKNQMKSSYLLDVKKQRNSFQLLPDQCQID